MVPLPQCAEAAMRVPPAARWRIKQNSAAQSNIKDNSGRLADATN
jgi:hypothetical protein